MSGKILVLGGMHGNEPLGIELVGMLLASPLTGIDAAIANPSAVTASVRFIEDDLNRSFPGQKRGSYEQRRAVSLLRKTQDYDLVLDFHNTLGDQASCGFVGLQYDVRLLQVAATLGIKYVIEAGYDCVNQYALNCLSVELAMNDGSAADWYEKLKDMPRVRTSNAVGMYRFMRRITWKESERVARDTWRPFTELADCDKQEIAISGSACPIFIGSTLTQYYATLVERINSPSDTIETKEENNGIIDTTI